MTRIWILPLMLLAGSSWAGCPGDETHYRLYRSSSAIQGAAIHVATFDSDQRGPGGSVEEFNRGNCEIVRQLLQSQPGVIVTYWCERVQPRQVEPRQRGTGE